MSDKIAIVADIHANKYALNKFIEYVDKEKISTILNLGDFVQIGPNPLEVTEIILNDKRFINIIGNNETGLFEITADDSSDENKHRIWTKEKIQDKFLEIQKMPQEKTININNLNILMIHFERNNISGMPSINITGINEFFNEYDQYNADIILFGHTHEKLYIEQNSKIFINPGSLGCSKMGTVDFVTVEITNKKIENCTFNSLEYNKSKLFEDYINNNVPDKDFLLRIFYKK